MILDEKKNATSPQSHALAQKPKEPVSPTHVAGTNELDQTKDRETPHSSKNIAGMGRELEEILAHPNAHTLGDLAAIVERLHRELSLLQPNASGHSQLLPEAPADDNEMDLAAIFERELNATELSSHEIDDLARSLQLLKGAAVSH